MDGNDREMVPRNLRRQVTVEGELQLEKPAKTFRIKTQSLSLNGCYIEMLFTLEVGTDVMLSLWIDAVKLTTNGLVVSRHLQMGNGIRFVGLTAENSARLRRFLEGTRPI
jgi:hypothetical protein